MKVYTKCSNYASETCPCILAEAGHCIVCSMCRGEDYCDCSDTLTYCIYQELKNNGGKSKDQHNIIRCEIVHEKMINEIYKHLRLKVPRHVVDLLKMPGSFVFIRKKENAYYDVPISVFLTDMENETIDLIIKIIGVKTEEFKNLEKGDNVYLRGPYHNGILGIKDLSRLKGSKAAVICKGIGFIPSLGVIKTLCRDGNEVTVYLDYGTFSEELMDAFISKCNVNIREISVCDEKGNLTEEMRSILVNETGNGCKLIHFGLSDYLLKKSVSFVKDHNSSMMISNNNNAHMCCGEGICGSCAVDKDVNTIVHLCKEQIDPYDYINMI